MIRHPHYLEVPWEIHWHGRPPGPAYRHLWWVTTILVLLAIFMIGVGVISGNV